MKNKLKVIAGVVVGVIVGVIIFSVIWNYEFRKPNENTSKSTTTQSESKPQKQTAVTLQGSGDQVKTVFLKRGLAMFSMTHNGNRNFAVWLKGSGGEKLEVLANEIGAYAGEKSIQIKKDGEYLIEVRAKERGKWVIDIY